MLDMARNIEEKLRGLSHADYSGDDNLRLAIIHLIQIIGELERIVPLGTGNP
jgi:uncharacterized protein with HEPN domain